MTQVSVKLTMPEGLKKQARKAGLLSPSFLRDAIERELQIRAAAGELYQISRKTRSLGMRPLTTAEVNAEIRAVRAARRGSRDRRR